MCDLIGNGYVVVPMTISKLGINEQIASFLSIVSFG